MYQRHPVSAPSTKSHRNRQCSRRSLEFLLVPLPKIFMMRPEFGPVEPNSPSAGLVDRDELWLESGRGAQSSHAKQPLLQAWAVTGTHHGGETHENSGRNMNPVTTLVSSSPIFLPDAQQHRQQERNEWGNQIVEGDRLQTTEALDDSTAISQPLTPAFTGSRADTNPFLRSRTPLSGNANLPGLYEKQKTQLTISQRSNNPWQPALDQAELATRIGNESESNPQFSASNPTPNPWASELSPHKESKSLHSDNRPPMTIEAESEMPVWTNPTALEPTYRNIPRADGITGDMVSEENMWANSSDQLRTKTSVSSISDSSLADRNNRDSGIRTMMSTFSVSNSSLASIGQPALTLEDVGYDPLSKMYAPGPSDRIVSKPGPPALPPKVPNYGNEAPPPLPPRPTPQAAVPAQSSRSAFSRGGEEDLKEKYQIKLINWYDATARRDKVRTSPILIQNANGPCPLVALVNTLVLTTPADVNDTALVHVLQAHKHVSLGLLLDAVFDELMSPRRTDPDAALPDVSLLYNFLKSLHYGMNVNPRFLPTKEDDQTLELQITPGTFEATAEMRLYSTFSIPLIHGWLPSDLEPEFQALRRQASSYEDVQNLLFREEELEDKLIGLSAMREGINPDGRVGLSDDEQELYNDIVTIRNFLDANPTQLTQWGLKVIHTTMKPGTFAILFRNDHFSTLYLQPQTLRLLTLVTDVGYASHPEVVWEELADVSGSFAEFYSGDFRLVGGPGSDLSDNSNIDDARRKKPRASISTPNDSEWPTVGSGSRSGATGEGQSSSQTRARSKVRGQRSRGPAASRSRSRGHEGSRVQNEEMIPRSYNNEQEDRDLALALQLQQEEDERAQAVENRRRQESRLSEAFIERQTLDQPANPTPAPRSSSIDATQTPVLRLRAPHPREQNTMTPTTRRPGLSPVTVPITSVASTSAGEPGQNSGEDAPPSYEQAAKVTAFEPPVGHPSHEASPASPPMLEVPLTVNPAQTPSVQAGQRLGQDQSQPSLAPMSRPMAMPSPPYLPSNHIMERSGTPYYSGQMGSRERDKECVVM